MAITLKDTVLKKYLALGDSYTIGQGVQANERYPYLAVQQLKAEGIDLSDPDYIATTGWTTADLEAAIDNQNPSNDYAVVTLLIGVNDQYQGVDTGIYRQRFGRLLNKAISLASNRPARVIVLSVPDYSATPFVSATDKERVSKEIDWFNAINKEISLSFGIVYLDITGLTKEAANDASLLADDHLHYSKKGYQKWSDLLAPAMKLVLH